MKKLRIYLDTSVINFLFADDAVEKQAITVDFFENFVRPRVHDTFISSVVVDEINKTRSAEKRQRLLDVIIRYQLRALPTEPWDEIVGLAKSYHQSGIIPERKAEDALHVAVATVQLVDALVSWNFDRLANVRKERQIRVANESLGYYYPMRIVTPLEVMGREETK
jgi:hypothetical protein